MLRIILLLLSCDALLLRRECEELTKLPVFVLNLQRRSDRLSKLSHFLSKKAPWLLQRSCRVEAPDGSRLNESGDVLGLATEAMAQAAIERSHSGTQSLLLYMTQGALALIFGHGRIWEHILQQDFPYAIVMEDDISELHPGLGSFLCDAMKGNVSWDLIQLQHWRPGKENRGLESQFQPSKPLELKPGTGYNTGMYMITKEAASKMLDYQFPLGFAGKTLQIDHDNSPLRSKLKGFHSEGRAASQSSEDTDVQIVSLLQANETLIKDCPPLDPSQMKLAELQKVLS